MGCGIAGREQALRRERPNPVFRRIAFRRSILRQLVFQIQSLRSFIVYRLAAGKRSKKNSNPG
jgi:hypothetical protein